MTTLGKEGSVPTRAAKPTAMRGQAASQYDIHGLVSVTSNVRLNMLPDYFKTNGETQNPFRVSVTYADPSRIGDEGEWTYAYHPFRGTLTKIGISSSEDGISLKFYDSVYKYSRRLRYPISQLCAGLVQYGLMRLGYTIAHGACLSQDGIDGMAVVGLSNVGKTTTTLRLVREKGFRFLADDMFITDGKTAFCFPRKLRLEHFPDIRLAEAGPGAASKRFIWTLASSIPFLPEVWVRPYTAAPVGPYAPLKMAKLTRIFFLRRGRADGPVTDLPTDEALRQFAIQQTIGTIDYDFAASRLFHMYAYESRSVNLIRLKEQQAELLRTLVSSCRCQQLTSPTPHFESIVLEALEKK